MNKYFSTFIVGMGDVVKRQLSKDLKDFQETLLLDGLIAYTTSSSQQEVSEIRYLNNSFVLLSFYDQVDDDKALEKIGERFLEGNLSAQKGKGGSFRVMAYRANEPTKIPKELLTDLERKIGSTFRLEVDRTSPDTEFWLLYRTEGYGFVGQRITKHPDWKTVLEKGQLRPELATLLSIISEPSPDDVVLDPFAGTAAIATERKRFPYKKVISGDKTPTQGVLEMDVLSLVSKIGQGSINKIVTDPPWGVSVGKELDLNNFYTKMLDQFAEVLRQNGIAVILMGNKGVFEKCLENNSSFSLLARYNILVSGKKAVIYKLLRN